MKRPIGLTATTLTLLGGLLLTGCNNTPDDPDAWKSTLPPDPTPSVTETGPLPPRTPETFALPEDEDAAFYGATETNEAYLKAWFELLSDLSLGYEHVAAYIAPGSALQQKVEGTLEASAESNRRVEGTGFSWTTQYGYSYVAPVTYKGVEMEYGSVYLVGCLDNSGVQTFEGETPVGEPSSVAFKVDMVYNPELERWEIASRDQLPEGEGPAC